jgi:hypothetical protein
MVNSNHRTRYSSLDITGDLLSLLYKFGFRFYITPSMASDFTARMWCKEYERAERDYRAGTGE